MTLKQLRSELANQIKLVRENAENIPQAESIANLAGKTLKAIQAEIQAEIMQSKGQQLKIFDDILSKE